jgi:hypothetical protein
VIVLVAFSSRLTYTVLGDASSEKLSARNDTVREKEVVMHAPENRSGAIEKRRLVVIAFLLSNPVGQQFP